ncbi:hypothetical protein BpHYR1_032320 [Brachionus plicatilis]|uniref:Uncharacterized protein n=1 Tax=Brachionus plicatilis TaxID=10195 RepID=A0A3M7T0H1_BRAPC|nr:hypothetical protein BpHYR1_032320 [Brachionus plicatilis]
MLFFFLDLKYKYKKFQEVNICLFQNLKFEPKPETNTFTIKNSNNVSKILSKAFYKIKAFHFTAFGDYFQEPIARLILKHFFSINETGYTEPQPHRNKYISDPHEIANMITLFSIIICIPSIVFLASNNWKKRLFVCVTFQIKSISDYIDGPIIRNFTSPNFSRSSFNYGRFLDGLAINYVIAKLLKEVYFKMTIFLIYFVLSGIQWNWSINKYRDKFSKEFVSQYFELENVSNVEITLIKFDVSNIFSVSNKNIFIFEIKLLSEIE